jgi:hypothetical protein
VAYLKTYEQTVLLAKSADDTVSDGIPEPLVKAILEARRKPEA